MYLQNFSNVIMNTFDAEENSSILNNSDAKWYKDALLSHQRDKSSIKNVSKFMIPVIVPCMIFVSISGFTGFCES